MKKQGFTLIELMVVVVIIGILAAVAVPKLFGMIAKSKASEVGPAAGEYVKLQQAYTSEKGDSTIGSWYYIGYSAPGEWTTKPTSNAAGVSKSQNFTYTEETTESTKISGNVIGFKASNIVKLNECAPDENWKVTLSGSTTVAGGIAFAATTDCPELTATFDNIGK
jgi:type IV pilus assembly protein PilA